MRLYLFLKAYIYQWVYKKISADILKRFDRYTTFIIPLSGYQYNDRARIREMIEKGC